MSDVVGILKDLVAIPSFVGNGNNEGELALFIEKFLQQRCPNFSFSRQVIPDVAGKTEKTGRRFNLIATDCPGRVPRLIFFCHLDTVEPKEGQLVDGKIVIRQDDTSIYGLGSVDMKGGTAALLAAVVKLTRLLQNVALVFYCDEEYDFLGMEALIEEPLPLYQAPLAIFCEPTDLQIINGCRGLAEFRSAVKGRTGHASVPENSLNAILLAVSAFNDLKLKFGQYNHPELGPNVFNLAAINGGLYKPSSQDQGFEIGRNGNNVPDYAEVVIESRIAEPGVSAKTLTNHFSQLIKKGGGNLPPESLIIRHDKACLFTARESLKPVERALLRVTGKDAYSQISRVGYYDAQMLNQAFGTKCIALGPAPQAISHQATEHVTIESLIFSAQIYELILREYCVV